MVTVSEAIAELDALFDALAEARANAAPVPIELMIVCPDCGKNPPFRNRCPKCGGALVCYKKLIVGSKIRRYRRCVNRRCDGRFVTRQDFEEIIREVEPYDKDSNAGKSELKIRRESA